MNAKTLEEKFEVYLARDDDAIIGSQFFEMLAEIEREMAGVETLAKLILSHSHPGGGHRRPTLGVNEVWELVHQLCPPPEGSDETSGWRGWPDLQAIPDDFPFVRRYFRAVGLLQEEGRMAVTGWGENPRAIQVEAGIFDLALALNRIRHTRTSGTCQGHPYVDCHTHAFAGFVCPFEIAVKLVQLTQCHKGFSVQISSPRKGSQNVNGRIEIRYAWDPPRQDVPNRPLQSLLDLFIADMEAAGLLTENVVPTMTPFVLWNNEEGVFLPSARNILDEAFQTADQLGHSYVDCEHLLYAVLKQLSPREKKVLPLFDMLHLSSEQLVRVVKADLDQLPTEKIPYGREWHQVTELVRDKAEATQPEGHPSLTRDAAEAIRRACQYSRERGRRNVSAYHLIHGVCCYLTDESFRRAIYRQNLGWR